MPALVPAIKTSDRPRGIAPVNEYDVVLHAGGRHTVGRVVKVEHLRRICWRGQSDRTGDLGTFPTRSAAMAAVAAAWEA